MAPPVRRASDHIPRGRSPPNSITHETQRCRTTAQATQKPPQETLHHWEQFICEEADLVEDRIKHEAKKSGVPFEMLMDALTIELTGRFFGRVRERDAQLFKTQPII